MGDPFKILFSREQEPKRIESRENELDSIESRPARAREERRIGLVGDIERSGRRGHGPRNAAIPIRGRPFFTKVPGCAP